MRDLDHRERAALDRHVTGNYGEDQFTDAQCALCGEEVQPIVGGDYPAGERPLATIAENDPACTANPVGGHQVDDEVVPDDMPDPCPHCDWVDAHEGSCPDATRKDREREVRGEAARRRRMADWTDDYSVWRRERAAADAYEARELAAIAADYERSTHP